MNRSSTGGIILSFALLFSITVISLPSEAYADEISITSVALEETSILELKNDSKEEVNTLRIWLGSDFNFKSFKTEKGWTGEKNSQGVIIFTSTESVKPGESVKFGVKTDKPNPAINWKVLDKKNIQIETGISVAKELPVVKNPKPNQNTENSSKSMGAESTFRVIPEKPNVGSSIRVTGDNFGASQEFDFYIDSKKIGSFDTDENGHFMTTMKIPVDQKADRIDFKIKDKAGEEKKLSLRIGEVENRIPISQDIPLTIQGIPSIVNRGDLLEIFGTGTPGKGITITINSPEGEVIRTRTAEVDSKGNWKLDPLLVPLDRPFGKYTGVITDGKSDKTISWTVESDKKIIITPTNLKFEPGEIMKFNGTAISNKSIEIVLEDPLGKEVFSDIISIDESGLVEFEYPTTQTTQEGTYALIATQDKEKEFTYVGLGQLPTIPVNLEFDKLNYKTSETAFITISGKASEIINLLIIDPSDKTKGDAVSIQLQPDGRGSHTIDLKGFASGVYTAVVTKGSAQNTEVFTVGLVVGSGDIEINTTKTDYNPGDPILVLGDTGSNVLLTLTLLDPNGKEIKIKETFSNKNGKISESSFRIPSDAIPGIWTINAKSGSNFDNTEIEVLASSIEGLVVTVEDGPNYAAAGKSKTIKVHGGQQTVKIEIFDKNGEKIENLSFPASSQGEINQPWIIPKDAEPGTYSIKVSDAFNFAESTFEIE
ncbi:biofilm-associated protein [Nitrosopumilus oxyclinae]|uniref:Biofilm-associated protein n=1 Tax=Nitrosopumilus oxyclinae TaxID=1959104 RepID=A0A7D5R0F3_9ARCH|nr:biofilm-associated protein [Nitrosopumilus oxyclinae]QLH05616.1 biofilm-associated protein [Nitrosopumilus oxyclinae]